MPKAAQVFVPRRGVKTRLVGVVLIFLGILDSLLVWRGGTAPGNSFLLLMVAGVAVYVAGAIRGRQEA
ncbi:MAG TPA: hypothetical protein QF813_06430 [Alphaproteobacteria bacterium]|jgi:hypothetical protein|nr:hypothetical protein [Alphaproteobacteria bacterium]|tara:strand:+ start:102 stop:305 length:204 start_codon:yes stop_codon:yes gene_type:complete